MAKRQAMKLFTVAVLAGSPVASAGPTHTTHTAKPPSTTEPVVQRTERNGYIELTIKAGPEVVATVKPRVLKNFRPACGNTGGKVDRPKDCTKAETRAAEEQAKIDAAESRVRSERMALERAKLVATAASIIRAQPSLKARVLINGRPACGNTMSKAGPPAYCRVGEDQ